MVQARARVDPPEGIGRGQAAQRIAVGDLLDALGDRALAALLFVFAFPNVLPVPPGTSAVLGAPLVFLAAQLCFGLRPWLPAVIARRSMPRKDFAALVQRIGPWLERAERLLRPRAVLLTVPPMEYLIGAVCLVLGLILTLPIPLGNVLPALSISLRVGCAGARRPVGGVRPAGRRGRDRGGLGRTLRDREGHAVLLPPGAGMRHLVAHGSNLHAIAAMVAACAMFACMDALLKLLAGHYPPLQVTALRGLSAMPLVCLYVMWRGQMRLVFSRRLRWGLHLLRGVVIVLMLALFVFGLQTLGLPRPTR